MYWRPSTSAQGYSQDNSILVEHPVEEPLIIAPFAAIPPLALLLFDSSVKIRASYNGPTVPEKDKGTSISDEADLSPSRSIPPSSSSTHISPSALLVSISKATEKAADDDIPLQSLLCTLKWKWCSIDHEFSSGTSTKWIGQNSYVIPPPPKSQGRVYSFG